MVLKFNAVDQRGHVCCGKEKGTPECCYHENCIGDDQKPATNPDWGRCCNPEKLCPDPNHPGKTICCPVGEECIEGKDKKKTCVTSCGPDDGSQKLYCKPEEEVCTKVEGITKPKTMSKSSLWVSDNDKRGTIYSCISNQDSAWRRPVPDDSMMKEFENENIIDLAFPTDVLSSVGDGMGFCGAKWRGKNPAEVKQDTVQTCEKHMSSGPCNEDDICEWLEISKIIDGKAKGELTWASTDADATNRDYIQNMVDQLKKRNPNMGVRILCKWPSYSSIRSCQICFSGTGAFRDEFPLVL